ncbi:MAG: hypothetical protein ACJ8M1_01540 [Chthoniobacterales bacterium]
MNAQRIVPSMSLICAALMAACSKQAASHVSEHRYLNACTVLTADQIRSVQGVPLKEAKPSGSGGPGFG